MIKPQLEEMMEAIPPVYLGLEGENFIKVGVLTFDGHIKPIIDAKVEGWLNKSRDGLNETYQIMHLDELVKFIFDNRLISEFREVLFEYNV